MSLRISVETSAESQYPHPEMSLGSVRCLRLDAASALPRVQGR